MNDIVEELEPIDAEPTRRVTPGVVVSAAGHVGLMVWLVAGWGLSQEPLPFEVTEVSVVSGEEYAAIVAATTPQPDAAQPIAPETPQTPEPPAPPEPLAPPPDAEDPVAPPAPEPPPEPPAEDLPVPTAPEPPPQTDVTDTVPEIVEPVPPAPPPSALALNNAPRPVPRPAPRVAPEAALPPPPEAEVAPQVQDASTQEALAEQVVEEAQEATAPEEATTEIVTEAETPSGAVETAIRPPSRPSRPTPPAEAAPQEADADAVAAAVAAATAGAAPDPGPPLTGGERDAFRLSVQGCWVVDPGSAAARVTVTVAFELGRDGRVVGNQVVMIGNTGGEPSAVQTAFESARRAVLRCQSDGFPLPPEKYEQWRVVEMTFNPADMRIR